MNVLSANWQAPNHIRALTTMRAGGLSQGGYASFNLADHVGDDPANVSANRHHLKQHLDLPSDPIWLNQTHSTDCVIVETSASNPNRNADAAITRQPNTVLAIMTADCLPITLCDRKGTEIAAIHAGWRGLANGILDNTLSLMLAPTQDCLAWIGPAICGRCYATGEEVLETFVQQYAFATKAFQRIDSQWYADLPKMAALILTALGLSAISQSAVCTFEANNQFYSYRRTAQTGRIATLIWFQDIL